MMKKKKFFRIYLIGLVFSIIFCTGCQKRQKTENLHILSEKETAHTGEAKKSESGLKEVLQIPDKLEKEMESSNKKNKVEIQAKILVPQVKSIPERTIMPRSYTQEETEAMIETIFQDGILYKMEDYTIEEESYCQVSGWNKAYNGKKYMFFLTDYHRLQNELSFATAMLSGPAIQLVRLGSEEDEWIAEGLTKEEAALLEEGQDEKTMKISHIELGYARVWNSSDENPEMKATLKPAWAFYGKATGKSGNREITSEYGDKNLLLAIDAATGEVLELTE